MSNPKLQYEHDRHLPEYEGMTYVEWLETGYVLLSEGIDSLIDVMEPIATAGEKLIPMSFNEADNLMVNGTLIENNMSWLRVRDLLNAYAVWSEFVVIGDDDDTQS